MTRTPRWANPTNPALRPATPIDYRSLIRLRRTLPAKALNTALGAIFDDIDLRTLAARGTRLARRASADTAAAAELAAIAVVLADAIASPTAARVTTTIAALRTRTDHTNRNGFELLMFAYLDLLTDPSEQRAGVSVTRNANEVQPFAEMDAQAAATAHIEGDCWNEVAAS